MIKTMLLTAQLALSPIVGTNGLQPKRLPNPVYGGEVDNSVTYNGKSYTRIMSGDYYAKDIQGGENGQSIYWGTFDEPTLDLEKVYSGSTNWAGETNVIKFPTSYYASWKFNIGDEKYYQDEIATPDDINTCFSFWVEKNNGYLLYNEVFKDTEGETTINQWGFTKGLTEWQNDDYKQPTTLVNLTLGCNIYSKDPYVINDWGNNPRNIQKNQPTIPNPSVYDNIYNFYYQNLFANEALDELGAEVGKNSLTMRQWLAHTATIVSISLLASALVILVIKIFKLIAGSISDIWG